MKEEVRYLILREKTFRPFMMKDEVPNVDKRMHVVLF
jgi:hypothetical protein